MVKMPFVFSRKKFRNGQMATMTPDINQMDIWYRRTQRFASQTIGKSGLHLFPNEMVTKQSHHSFLLIRINYN